jgi:hypothetical protein
MADAEAIKSRIKGLKDPDPVETRLFAILRPSS